MYPQLTRFDFHSLVIFCESQNFVKRKQCKSTIENNKQGVSGANQKESHLLSFVINFRRLAQRYPHTYFGIVCKIKRAKNNAG